MKAYFDSIEKEVPKQLQQVFLNRRDTAVITIDMHDGHLSTDPDCPCPSPRGREIIEPLNHFMNEARALGLPIIHVRSTLRKGGADEKLFPSAWRMVFPVTVGEIPNIAEHAIEGTRWNRMSIDVHDEDYMVTTKKRLSAFYPTDLELLLRNPVRVYSRENLLNVVWGYEYIGDYRTVDVHVRRLREKLELDPANPEYIRTKWGVGYYLSSRPVSAAPSK